MCVCVCVCVSVCTITCVWCAGGRWAGVSATVIVDQPILEEDEEPEKESGDNEKEEDSEMKTTTIGAHTALSLIHMLSNSTIVVLSTTSYFFRTDIISAVFCWVSVYNSVSL